MKPPARKESEIQREILRYLQARGIFAWKAGVGAMRAVYKNTPRFVRFGQEGMSDIVGVLPNGRFLAIEVKRPGGRVTTAQKVFMGHVNLKYGLAFIAHSVEEVNDRLSREGELNAYHGQRQPAPRAE